MSISLYDHQRSALEKMKNGCILCGGVGSGKSRTALAYYYLQQGGNLDIPDGPMKNPLDIYIITTARKRDTCEWENELAPFLLSTHEDCNYYKNKVIIDSWNNIGKYKDVKNSFFIFKVIIDKGKSCQNTGQHFEYCYERSNEKCIIDISKQRKIA